MDFVLQSLDSLKVEEYEELKQMEGSDDDDEESEEESPRPRSSHVRRK